MRVYWIVFFFGILIAMCWSCSDKASGEDKVSDVDGHTDADADSDTDADADTDTDTDADADTDADSDTDADADTDTDTDADADTDADSDTDADADTDADSDTDADADTDADSDTDADADTDTDVDADTDADTGPDTADTDTNRYEDTGTDEVKGTDTAGNTDTDAETDADSDTQPGDMVTVQIEQTRQEIAGFGINLTWSPPLSNERADLLFDPNKGIGISICRIGMGMDGDQLSDNIWADMRMARQRGVETFIGTLWSAPAECKTNNDVNDGGHLRENCYESWANTIAAFPAKVKQNTNIDLYAMSPQNEVDFASCGYEKPCNGNYPTMLYTSEELAAFVEVVGPKLHALNPPVKLIAAEVAEWNHLWSNESAPESPDSLNGVGYDYGHVLYEAPEAWAEVDILGVHMYITQVSEPWPDDVPKEKEIWQTEMSGVKWFPEEGPSAHIENGVAVAGWIHNGLTVGEANAWVWWWIEATMTDDNEGLFLMDGTITKRLYTLGNFSKFIRPGHTRVNVTGTTPENILLSAYKGTDGTVVIVAINRGNTPVTVPMTIAGGTAPVFLTPWVTSVSDNLVSKTAISVNGGEFTATLPGMSVTTFVGK